MAFKLKPKVYGPLIIDCGEPDLSAFTTQGGHQARLTLSPSQEGSSPSDLILAALGSCIHISLSMAAQQLSLEATPVRVVVNATKAVDLPHRIGQFDVDITLRSSCDAAAIDALIKKTKEMCTISNTLAADIVIRCNSPS